MRRLAVSLTLALLCATIGVGWALDRLFDRLSESRPAGVGEPLDDWRRLGGALADSVAWSDAPSDAPSGDGSDDRQALIAALAIDAGIAVSLVRADRLGLDRPALAGQLRAPLGLALESSDGVTVYYALDSTDRRLLALKAPAADAAPSMLRLVLTSVFYLAVLSMLLLWLLPLARRLARLREAAVAFGRGDLDARVAIERRSELADLEAAFNAMAARIGALIDDNRLLGRGVAHDLKTPLTRLRFGIDALQELDAATATEGLGDSVRRSTMVARLQNDLDAMASSLQALLDYARFDARSAGEPHRSIDLSRLVGERHVAREAAQRKRIELQPSPKPMRLIGSERELVALVDNLLDNALQHGRERVIVRVKPAGQARIELSVEDDGAGVPEADRERLLRPFERGDPGKGGSNGNDGTGPRGHGLGLALVARISERHHGQCAIDTSAHLGGAVVRITLPRDG